MVEQWQCVILGLLLRWGVSNLGALVLFLVIAVLFEFIGVVGSVRNV